MAELRSLARSPGWALLVKALDEQTRECTATLAVPAEGVDGMVRKEHVSGQLEQCGIFGLLPDELMEVCEEVINEDEEDE